MQAFPIGVERPSGNSSLTPSEFRDTSSYRRPDSASHLGPPRARVPSPRPGFRVDPAPVALLSHPKPRMVDSLSQWTTLWDQLPPSPRVGPETAGDESPAAEDDSNHSDSHNNSHSNSNSRGAGNAMDRRLSRGVFESGWSGWGEQGGAPMDTRGDGDGEWRFPDEDDARGAAGGSGDEEEDVGDDDEEEEGEDNGDNEPAEASGESELSMHFLRDSSSASTAPFLQPFLPQRMASPLPLLPTPPRRWKDGERSPGVSDGGNSLFVRLARASLQEPSGSVIPPHREPGKLPPRNCVSPLREEMHRVSLSTTNTHR